MEAALTTPERVSLAICQLQRKKHKSMDYQYLLRVSGMQLELRLDMGPSKALKNDLPATGLFQFLFASGFVVSNISLVIAVFDMNPTFMRYLVSKCDAKASPGNILLAAVQNSAQLVEILPNAGMDIDFQTSKPTSQDPFNFEKKKKKKKIWGS